MEGLRRGARELFDRSGDAVRGAWSGLHPRPSDYRQVLVNPGGDLVGAVHGALWALPGALVVGLVCGTGPGPAVLAAALGGLVAAVLGGPGVRVVGPSLPAAVALVPVVTQFSTAAVVTTVVMVGLLLVVLGAARVAPVLARPGFALVQGFVLGTAATLVLHLVGPAVGAPTVQQQLAGGAVGVDHGALAQAWAAVTGPKQAMAASLVVAAASLVAGLVLARSAAGWPAALGAVAMGTLVRVLFGLDAATLGALDLATPQAPVASGSQVGVLVGSATAVALLVAAHGLTTARAACAVLTERAHDEDREVAGLGAGTVLAALWQGTPVAADPEATGAALRRGARSRTAGAVAAVLTALVLLVPGVTTVVPVAAVAGTGMFLAWRTVHPVLLRTAARAGAAGAVTVAAVAVSCVALGLAGTAGLVMTVVLVMALGRPVVDLTRRARTGEDLTEPFAVVPPRDHVVVVRLDGVLSEAAPTALATVVGAARHDSTRAVVMCLGDLDRIDTTGPAMLGRCVDALRGRGCTVVVQMPDAGRLEVLRGDRRLADLFAQTPPALGVDEALAVAEAASGRDLDVFGVDHQGKVDEKFSGAADLDAD